VKKLFGNKWFWIALGTLMVVVSVVATIQGKRGKAHAVTVALARTREIVQKVKAPGEIEARTTVKISADIPGRIVELAVREGDTVKRGQLLLELDNTQYSSGVQQAQAALVAARSRLDRAETAWRLAQSTYERKKALFERKLLSTQEMDVAENEYATARTERDTAREEIARLQAVLTGARDNLSKTTYRSPIDGQIVGLNVEVGEIVITGTMNNPGTQILAVADLSRMQVKADVDETDVVDVQVGQKAKITVDAMPDTSFTGTVVEVGNSATRATSAGVTGETNYEVKVLFDHTVPEIRPGMTADVEIETRRAEKALAIPIQSVVVRQPEDLQERGKVRKAPRAPKEGAALAAVDDEPDPAERKRREITGVFVMQGEKAVFRRLRTGISSDTQIEVLPGGELKEGERVVTGPYKVLRDLRPGDRLELQKKGKPGAAGAEKR
jgi:HlyD family secretion protein